VVDRKLLVLVCAVVLVETLFFAALTPLLPDMADEFGLSKSSIGLLSAAYPAGGTLGAVLGGWLATRVGVRMATVGGTFLLSVSCAGFGIADGIWLLDALRFGQGVGGAIAWTGGLAWIAAAAPPQRRGELLGIAMSAAVTGALLGPLLGGAASLTSRTLAFGGIATLGLVLAAWAARMPAPELPAPQPLSVMLDALRHTNVLTGVSLVALPSALFGALTVLGPLSLDDVGVGALGMTLFWLVGAAIGAAGNPFLGLWSDRVGTLRPVRVGLASSIAVSLAIPLADDRVAIIALVLVASVVYNIFWVPGAALLTRAAEERGVGHGFSFALFNLSWAPAGAIGALAGGALADLLGVSASYLVLGGLCVAMAFAVTPRRVAVAG
jgi:predicted MFS family arabinose efflux permease